MIRKKLTLIFSIISGILIIIAYFFPFLSTFYAGENHRYYLDGTIFIVEVLGTTRFSFLIPGEFISILFTLTSITFWITGIVLLIDAALIIGYKKRQTNIFCILCSIVGALLMILVIIVYFTFPFIGTGIILAPDLGFILSLIAGVSAIGAGIIDIIKEKCIFLSK